VRSLSQQASDFIVYLAIPVAALVLPARWSRALVARASNWSWLMAPACEQAWVQAAAHTRIADEREWRRQWRRVEMMDARDTYMLALGRKHAVLGEIAGVERLEAARGRVIVGMHWGPQISVVRLLAEHGMKPALVHRSVEREIAWSRPFYYLFLRLALREVVHACAGRSISVGGAMDKLRQRLTEDGVEIVVLDAPPTRGRSVLEGRVLGRRAVFNAGFPDVLAESGKEYVFFAIGLDRDGRLTKVLDLGIPARVEDPAAFLDDYCVFLDQHLVRDSAHWRIWQVAGQFFPPPESREATDEPRTEPAAEAPIPAGEATG
jgi:hypothetical protein